MTKLESIVQSLPNEEIFKGDIPYEVAELLRESVNRDNSKRKYDNEFESSFLKKYINLALRNTGSFCQYKELSDASNVDVYFMLRNNIFEKVTYSVNYDLELQINKFTTDFINKVIKEKGKKNLKLMFI